MLNTRIVAARYGGPDVLDVVQEPLQEPKKGEVRIKVECAGVALADVMRRKGVYPMSPTRPFTPGYDVVGVIDELGEGVQQYAQGEKVGVLFNGIGGYASYVYAAVDEIFKAPTSIDPALSLAVILNYVTAYQMLHRFAKVAEGDTILIHGASGGVGTALLELGRLAKVKMFGTASSAKHHIVSQLGAIAIDYRDEDFVQVTQQLAPTGMDAVFDPIGGVNWQRSFQTLSKGGRFVGYGYTSVLGSADSNEWLSNWRELAETNKTTTGNPAFLYSITSFKKERPDLFREDVRTLFSLLEEGKINPLVSHRIPLRKAARAQERLEKSAAVGKIVLIGS